MQRPARPTGVAILAAVDILAGISLLVLGGLLAEPCPPDTGCHLTGLMNSLAVLPLIAGVLSIMIGYGLWSRLGWGWTSSVVLGYLGIILVAVGLVFSIWALGPNIFVPVILLSAILIGNLIVLLYLRRPHIKAYFGKGK